MITKTKIDEWVNVHRELSKLKKQEMSLRKEICEEYGELPVNALSKTSTLDMEDYSLKITTAYRQSVDREVLLTFWDELDEEERKAIVWKPSLVASVYKHLPEESILHDAVTEKLSTPSIKIAV